jgi:hypothetical protein
VTLRATDAIVAENGGRGRLQLARTGSTAAPLLVTLTTSGVATPGVDLAGLPTTVSFPAGAATVDLPPRHRRRPHRRAPNRCPSPWTPESATGVPNTADLVIDDGAVAASLAGAWRFDEIGGATLNDASGGQVLDPGNLGAAPATPSRAVAAAGNALVFDGVDDVAWLPGGDWIPGRPSASASASRRPPAERDGRRC